MPTPEQNLESDTAYLSQLPPAKRCAGRPPWRDPELRDFAGVSQAIAGAVKYADKEVIVVSRSAGPIPENAQRYAEERGVTLRRISIDHFDAERLERFRWMHFAPSPGDSYHPPYDWCYDHVPPIM